MSELLHSHENMEGVGLTGDLWKNFPLDQILVFQNWHMGFGVLDNFVSFDVAVDAAAATVGYGSGGQRLYFDTGCSIRQLKGSESPLACGGGIRIATPTTDNVEAWIQWGGATGSPFVISDSVTKELIFQMPIRVSTITTTKFGFFVGLAEEGLAAENTIADGGAMASKDYIGFHRAEDGGGLDFVYRLAGQNHVVHAADIKVLVANTWTTVGFRLNPRNRTILPWIDGVAVPASIITATQMAVATGNAFPDGQGLHVLAGGKNAVNEVATLDIGWVACAQRAAA